MTRSIYILIALFFTCVFHTAAQELPDRFLERAPGLAGRSMANYVFTKRGDLPIHVSVWGVARNPGRYEVPEGTDLGQLLSLAGGPGYDTRGFIVGIDQRERQRRGKTYIRISRSSGGNTDVVLESRIDNLLYEEFRHFKLEDGDVIMVDMVQRINIWDGVMIISASASLILLLDRIFVIF